MLRLHTATLAAAVLLPASYLTAQQPATTAPEATSRTHKSAGQSKLTTPDPGTITEGIYHSAFFGFQLKLPYGWVERTREMQQGNEASKSVVLLAVFERPPEATGDTVNSAVVITAEPASTYPGLKTAADYFGPLTELATSKGLKVVNEPYDFPVGATHLVRADFSKPEGSLTMQQSSLALLTKGYVLSFMLIGGSDDDVDELVEGLSFGSSHSPAKPH